MTFDLHSLNAFTDSFEEGSLSISQRQGIVKSIPKKENLSFIYNWRLINRVNVDVQICSSSIANRIKPLLKHIPCIIREIE